MKFPSYIIFVKDTFDCGIYLFREIRWNEPEICRGEGEKKYEGYYIFENVVRMCGYKEEFIRRQRVAEIICIKMTFHVLIFLFSRLQSTESHNLMPLGWCRADILFIISSRSRCLYFLGLISKYRKKSQYGAIS